MLLIIVKAFSKSFNVFNNFHVIDYFNPLQEKQSIAFLQISSTLFYFVLALWLQSRLFSLPPVPSVGLHIFFRVPVGLTCFFLQEDWNHSGYSVTWWSFIIKVNPMYFQFLLLWFLLLILGSTSFTVLYLSLIHI